MGDLYGVPSTEYRGGAVIRPPQMIGKKEEETSQSAERRALLAEGEKRELVSADTAARLLGKSRDTIYRWLVEGRLAGRRVGGRWWVYKDGVEKEWEAGVVGEED